MFVVVIGFVVGGVVSGGAIGVVVGGVGVAVLRLLLIPLMILW